MFVPQINIVTVCFFLIGSFGHKFNGLHGTGFNAGLFAARASFFIPIRSVQAQIAFGRFFDFMIPYCPVRLLRAHLEAGFAADTLLLIDSSNVAVLFVHKGSINRTIAHAGGINALTARRLLEVVREFSERILHYLDARKG